MCIVGLFTPFGYLHKQQELHDSVCQNLCLFTLQCPLHQS